MAEKIDKAKKRKRQAEDTSKPSKKVALDRAKNIKISLPETDKWAPVIGMASSALPLWKKRDLILYSIYPRPISAIYYTAQALHQVSPKGCSEC